MAQTIKCLNNNKKMNWTNKNPLIQEKRAKRAIKILKRYNKQIKTKLFTNKNKHLHHKN